MVVQADQEDSITVTLLPFFQSTIERRFSPAAHQTAGVSIKNPTNLQGADHLPLVHL